MSLATVSRFIASFIHPSRDASNKIAIETKSIGVTMTCFLCSVTKITTRQMSYIEL
jgi:hypothetical protein